MLKYWINEVVRLYNLGYPLRTACAKVKARKEWYDYMSEKWGLNNGENSNTKADDCG